MKRVLIGISLSVMGIIITLGVMLCAAICLPSTTAWNTSYPSKLFFLIFAGQSPFADGANGLGLGIFFVFGIVLTLIGLVMLLIEYFRKESKQI